MADWKFIWTKIQDWHHAGRTIGLATVVETWGSSPRPVGSHLILNDQGMMEGSVSGGCVEGAVISALEEVMAGAEPRILEFSVTSEQAWQVGLSCGGRIRVLVENVDAKIHLVEELLSTDHELLLTTDVRTGESKVIAADAGVHQSGFAEENDGTIFQQFLVQPLELIIIGAVHISQAMVQMAKTLGISSKVVDPRTAFAQQERFPETELIADWPDDVLHGLNITSGTAIVTLTHDSKLDDAALAVALRSPAFYIASLGSRKTHASRQERLLKQGFSGTDISRIHGPAGLNIGAKSPSEIALSVLSQMICVYRQGESL